MNELIAFVALFSASSGAILSTLSGWWNAPDTEKFKKGKLASSLIIAILSSFALVNFSILQDQISSFGIVGLIATYLMVGFGLDQATSKLDRG